MDPVTVLRIAGILKCGAEKAINNAKLDHVIHKLDELSVICSEIILRDLRSGFKSMQDYFACVGNEKQWNIIDHIQEGLLKNTGLDPKAKLGAVKAADVIALSYYGLAYIHSFQRNDEVAQRYVFRMFESSSRLARKDLAPEVFEKLLRPHCHQCYQDHESRLKRQAQKSDYLEQAARGVYGATIGVGAVMLGLAHPSLKGAAVAAGRHIQDVWKDGTDGKVWASGKVLEELLESSLDEQCAKIAGDILNGTITV